MGGRGNMSPARILMNPGGNDAVMDYFHGNCFGKR